MAESSPSATARLGTSAILTLMSDVLPARPADDETPAVSSSQEAIALLVHAYLTALDFTLCGFDEDKSLSSEDAAQVPRLASQWNAGSGSLVLVYTHKQSSMRFLARVDRMGGKVEVRGLAVGDDRIYRFDRTTRDVVRADGLPLRIPRDADGQEDRTALTDKLRRVFVSDQIIADILRDLQVNIIQKLIPKLQKEGYVEVVDDEAEATARSERRAQEARNPLRPTPLRDDNNPQPSRPHPLLPDVMPDLARPRPGAPVPDFAPPGFEDEFEMNRPPQPRPGGGIVMPDGRSPFNIGHDDLHPPGLGPHDPLRGSFIPGRGGAGPSGMHPSFDSPLFGSRGGDDGSGAEGFDPQAPPGARWDPVGPGGGPRFPGPGNPFGGSGGFGGGFGGGGII